MSKKVLMLLNAPYPADIRVKKEADALIQAGFSICLLCLRKQGQPTHDTFEGIQLRRVDAGKNNYQLAFWDVVMSATFVHPIFLQAASKICKEEGIALVHVHDLPLVGTALKLRGNLKVKVIADMHENYPEALRTWFKWKKHPVVRLKNALFMNPARWTAHEKRACLESDATIAVVEEMKDRLVKEHQVPVNKIFVVTNTEDKSFLTQQSDAEVYSGLRGKFILTYSGGIGPHRGVDVAIKGMTLLKQYQDIALAIVGFGSKSVMTNLERLVKSEALANVQFYGYQPFSKFYSYMHYCDVNIIPHQSTGHTDNTVPHKLFQGMMAGRPLLVSSSAPLKRIVEHHHCGLVFQAGDAQDFAAKVLQLYRNINLQQQLGANGLHATTVGNINWEHDQQTLVALYNSLQ